MLAGDDKICAESARIVKRVDVWDKHAARLFACDCAERVLHLTDDNLDRPRIAIETSRAVVAGVAGRDEQAAARDAVEDAAWDAAWDAARGTARGAARGAARAAARAAAWDAAWDAARGAARAASWDAAEAAARGAAWDTAWAAADPAVRAAAEAAVRAAAEAAAWAAERAWQVLRLRWYLDGCPLPVPPSARIDAQS